MADEHILSKEELDALLGNGEQGDSSALHGHALGETMRVVLQSGGEALGRLCGADLSFDVRDIHDSPAQIDLSEGAYHVVYQLIGELEGQMHLLLSDTVATAIVDVLNEEPATDRVQATEVLAEAMNVVGGSLAETMSDVLAADVTVMVQDATWIEAGSDGTELPEQSVAFLMAVRFGDMESATGHVLVPDDVADALMVLLTDAAGIDGGLGQTDASQAPMEPLTSSGSVQSHRRPAATQHVSTFRPAQFAPLDEGEQATSGAGNLDLLLDVPLRVTVELGRTVMQIRDILALSKGQVIELDKLAGEPVDVLVNDKLIAKGEVVVMDEHFGVKITHIVSRSERVQNLK